MLNPKNLTGYLDNSLLKSIISEYLDDIKNNSDFELIQLSIFIGFIEIEDWLEHFYEVIKNGNCYEVNIKGIKVVILRVATYKEDSISIFPFYKRK